VSAALFGLAGVALGAVLSGSVAYAMERRRESQRARARARVLEEELEPLVGHLYRLRAAVLMRDRVAFEASRARVDDFPFDVWRANRETIASTTPVEEWYSVMRAFVALEELRAKLAAIGDRGLPSDETASGVKEAAQGAESAVYNAVDTLGKRAGRRIDPGPGVLRGPRW
jgi:hypothetical protein